MEPLAIIKKYYDPDSEAYRILTTHSRLVAEMALALAARVKELNPRFSFIEEAAMLHDIGIFMVDAPKIDCHGDKPYVCHGFLGRQLLEREGYPEHALVCERHTGVGITATEIIAQGLPLPPRDMVPVTLEEKIICFADKFYSKKQAHIEVDRSVRYVRKKFLADFGEDKVTRFDALADLFKYRGYK